MEKVRNEVILILIISLVLVGSSLEYHWDVEASTEPAASVKKVVANVTYPEKKEVKELTIEQMIINYCKDYEVDYKLAIAISKLETGHWTSPAYIEQNNPGGLKESVAGTYRTIEYESMDDGVNSFIKTLANIGTSDLYALAKIYCPDSPKHWTESVEAIINE